MSKVIVNNIYSELVDVDPELRMMINDELAARPPGYFFDPAFKAGMYDGYERFYNKATKTFPTGLLDKVMAILGDVEVVDERIPMKLKAPKDIKLFEPDAEGGVITLRDYQYDSVASVLKNMRGVVNVATNGGKTEIASGVIQQLLPKLKKGETILFVTHSKEIFNQSAKRLERRLNMNIGKVGNGKWDVQPITVVMIPTVSKHINEPSPDSIVYNKDMKGIKLVRHLLEGSVEKGSNNRKTMTDAVKVLEEKIESDETKSFPAEECAVEILTYIITSARNDNELLKEYGKLEKELTKYQDKKLKEMMKKHKEVITLLESAKCFIGDEVHHASSVTWYDTLMLCKNAVYRVGLTGTIDKKDPVNVMRLFGCVGPILTKISNKFLIDEGYSARPTIHLSTILEPKINKNVQWLEAYRLGIVENKLRNNLIADQVHERYKAGDGCLIVVNHVSHGESMKERLQLRGVECEFTHGAYEGRERVLDDMKSGELKVLIATSILDEGIDISGINSIWLAAGGRSYRQVLQRIGRALRVKADGSGVDVYDYLDYGHEILTKHSLARYQYYKNEKFEVRRT